MECKVNYWLKMGCKLNFSHKCAKAEKVKTLSCCRTKDLVKFEESMAVFSLFGGICHDQFPILTNIFYGCKVSTLSWKEWPYPTINPNISYTLKKS